MVRSTKPSSSGTILQLKVSLRETDPPVWRRILIRDTTTLEKLHALIQDTMGWQNYHLWEFVVRGEHYEAADPEATGRDAAKMKLKDLPLETGESFEYVYDPGDDWQHEIVLETRLRVDPEQFYPACTAGARACPLEDSGGPWRYAEILEILANPKHPEYPEIKGWIGNDFHPEAFDLRATNRILRLAFGRGVV